MALTLNVNSYATVETAAAYFEDRLDVSAWETASSVQKAQSLVTASLMLNEIRWVGKAAQPTQRLAFPREGAYYDTMLEDTITLESTTVPARIVEAALELAHHLLNNDGLLDSIASIDSLEVGSIKLNNIRTPARFPNVVRRLFGPLEAASSSSNGTWWRAN